MTPFHLVRVGVLGHVGRFSTFDATQFPRGSRVVVRTTRGLELGDVLDPPHSRPGAGAERDGQLSGALADGVILRGMTPEDELLEIRLQKNRDAAYRACAQRLRERRVPATLIEVEHLFDGRGLYFYFLGDPPPQVDAITAELAELYDAEVQFRRFAETLAAGCGPGCGTEHASGANCGSCGTGCAVATACGRRG